MFEMTVMIRYRQVKRYRLESKPKQKLTSFDGDVVGPTEAFVVGLELGP